MTYVDAFLAAVSNSNKQAYIDHATSTAAIFKKHGALSIAECWGDDVPDGDLTSMPMAVKKADDETVVISWVTWPDKAARDAGWEKVVAEMESNDTPDMPFDGKRIIFGGFEMVLKA